MEIQHGKGPWAPPVNGIVPLGSTLTLVVAINDYRGESIYEILISGKRRVEYTMHFIDVHKYVHVCCTATYIGYRVTGYTTRAGLQQSGILFTILFNRLACGVGN